MRLLFSFFVALLFISTASGQRNFWTPMNPESFVLPEKIVRQIQPRQFKGFELDYPSISEVLAAAPMEFTAQARQKPLILTLPFADGSLHRFKVWESPVMAKALMAKYPELHTYAGKDADGEGYMLRLDIGYSGLNAFIFGPDGHFQSVRPYTQGNRMYYMAYRQEDILGTSEAENVKHLCGTDDLILDHQKAPTQHTNGKPENEEFVTLRKYRVAISTQGEYSQHFGGDKTAILNSIVTALNFITAIQERDWAVRLELIPNDDTLFYYDPATDPFTGPYVSNWIGDNPGAINSRIPQNSYDIGHLFSKVLNPQGVYVAGLAVLSGVCTQIQKAQAGSSLPNPTGEDYYLIVAHEMGHQFSATHTFNSCPPAQDAQTPSTAYEPGGGSTIMSYSTTCTPDVVGPTDAYYHVASIEQVQNFITHDVGSTCPVSIITTNHPPTVNIPQEAEFYIPIKTPFILEATGSDPDGDPLTYTWEEFDLGPISSLGQPIENSPIFRSLPPGADPFRIFPKIKTVLTNTSDEAEVLPTYNRQLTFKVTARDGYPGSGGVAIDQVFFHSTTAAGPFRVSYPTNIQEVWNVGEFKTVTWDIANTDVSPVNCHLVNILLSLDGGYTYPVVLASNQPNIGRACIQVPDNVTTMARVMVRAADNIFFDISNTNFKIQQAAAPAFSVCPGTMKDQICLPQGFSTQIQTNIVDGFSTPIDFSISGLPNGATAEFIPNPAPAGSAVTLNVQLPANAPETTFDVVVTASAAGSSLTSTITLNTIRNDFSTVLPISPAYGASGVNTTPLLSWGTSADADFYEVQLADNPSFAPGTIIAEKTNAVLGTYQVSTVLTEGGVYYWRVRPKNGCGEGAWSAPQPFVVSILNCVELAANDVPVAISPNGTPTVESKITLLSGGQISDVNVKKVAGYHDYFKDLEVHVISPAGTDVTLWKNRCSSEAGNFSIAFDDGAASSFSCPPPNSTPNSRPTGVLGNFNGQNAAGVWILRVKDNTISGGGNISAFELEICSNEATNPPIITVNNVLPVPSGGNSVVDAGHLKAEDSNNPPVQLIYTILEAPQHGELQSNGFTMHVGDRFNQTDIDNGFLKYYDWGWNQGQDQFRFVVSDGEGGMATGIFLISPTVGATTLEQGPVFNLSPNPADDQIQLTLREPLASDARVELYNTAGQRLREWTLGAGATALNLRVAELPEGVYTIALQNAAGRMVRKVVLR